MLQKHNRSLRKIKKKQDIEKIIQSDTKEKWCIKWMNFILSLSPYQINWNHICENPYLTESFLKENFDNPLYNWKWNTLIIQPHISLSFIIDNLFNPKCKWDTSLLCHHPEFTYHILNLNISNPSINWDWEHLNKILPLSYIESKIDDSQFILHVDILKTRSDLTASFLETCIHLPIFNTKVNWNIHDFLLNPKTPIDFVKKHFVKSDIFYPLFKTHIRNILKHHNISLDDILYFYPISDEFKEELLKSKYFIIFFTFLLYLEQKYSIEIAKPFWSYHSIFPISKQIEIVFMNKVPKKDYIKKMDELLKIFYIQMNLICENYFLTQEQIKFIMFRFERRKRQEIQFKLSKFTINWHALSKNQYLTPTWFDTYIQHSDLWDWTFICKNQNITTDWLELHIDDDRYHWDWKELTMNPIITNEYILSNRFQWNIISLCKRNIKLDFIESYMEEKDEMWTQLSRHNDITTDYIDSHLHYEWNWNELCKREFYNLQEWLSKHILDPHYHWDWTELSKNKKISFLFISETFIEYDSDYHWVPYSLLFHPHINMEFFLKNNHQSYILLFPGKNLNTYSIAKVPFIEDIQSFKKVIQKNGRIEIQYNKNERKLPVDKKGKTISLYINSHGKDLEIMKPNPYKHRVHIAYRISHNAVNFKEPYLLELIENLYENHSLYDIEINEDNIMKLYLENCTKFIQDEKNIQELYVDELYQLSKYKESALRMAKYKKRQCYEGQVVLNHSFNFSDKYFLKTVNTNGPLYGNIHILRANYGDEEYLLNDLLNLNVVNNPLEIIQRQIQEYLYENNFRITYKELLPILLDRFEQVYIYDFSCRACSIPNKNPKQYERWLERHENKKFKSYLFTE